MISPVLSGLKSDFLALAVVGAPNAVVAAALVGNYNVGIGFATFAAVGIFAFGKLALGY